MKKLEIELKILDLDTFKDFSAALVDWSEEMSTKSERTSAESALLIAAVNLAAKPQQ